MLVRARQAKKQARAGHSPYARSVRDDSGGRTHVAGTTLLALSYVGFVSLGLPDGMLGAAWPAMRLDLQRPLAEGGQVTLLGTFGIIVSSALSGHALSRAPIGVVLGSSTLLASAALVMFATAQAWSVMLLAAVVAGCGGGAVDAALNRFVGQHYSARHMSWLHGCWGVGATCGPLTVAALLHTPHSWRAAYASVAGVELALGLSFLLTRRRWERAPMPAAAELAGPPTDSAIAGQSNVALPMAASVGFFLLYCGVESGVGLWAASLLIETRGASIAIAGLIVSVYWGLLTVGRFVVGSVADRVGPALLVRGCCVVAVCALAGLCVPAGAGVAAACLGVLGFALAPIYPLVMHDTPRRFTAAQSQRLVGYQVAAGGVGIALVPWLLGHAAQLATLRIVPPLLLALCSVLLVLERLRRASPSTAGAGAM